MFRRAARMKNRGAFRRRQTGQFQFLERRCRHGRNSRPMFDDFRRKTPRLADFPVGGVVIELKREEFERQRVKISEGRVTRVPIMVSEFGVRSSESGPRGTRPSERMISRKRAAKFESSIVMRFLFAGWFSATADRHYSAKLRCGKRDCHLGTSWHLPPIW